MEKRKRNPVAKALQEEQFSHHYINRTKADILKQELEEEAEEQLKEYLNGIEKSRQEPV